MRVGYKGIEMMINETKVYHGRVGYDLIDTNKGIKRKIRTNNRRNNAASRSSEIRELDTLFYIYVAVLCTLVMLHGSFSYTFLLV